MTKNFEDTILSLLRGMDQRMDGMAGDIAELKTGYNHLDKKIDLVIDILAEHTAKLKEHDERFSQIDERFSQIDERFSKIDERFSKIDERFSQIDERFSQIDERFSQIDKRFDEHDRMFRQIIDGVIPEMETRTKHSMKLKNHERRITALESA